MSGFKRHDEKHIDPKKVWADDVFQTLGKYADFLTNALTANTKNFVLNVNGSWGTGKSFFVQRWAEELRQKKYPVVEFNAWENDSAEDPLAPLIATVLDQQKDLLPAQLAKKMKESCGKFLLAGGGLIVRAGLKHLVGEKGVDKVNDLLSSGAENELIKLAGNYVDEQLEKQKASDGLKTVLKEFVEGISNGETHKLPIFIFIDEIDRCRPTFAIELLERVKHLFHVDGIKFIISTDTEQLVHSIAGVYGDRFEGNTYLHRFFDETFTLPLPDAHQFSRVLFADFDPTRAWMNHWLVAESPAFTFGELALQLKLTLRDQIKAHHRVMAVTDNIPASSENKLHFMLICVLVMLRIKHPDDYRRLTTFEGKHAVWEKIKQERRISITNIQAIDTYFLAMDRDVKSIREMAETIRNSDNGQGDYKTVDLRFNISYQCGQNYAVFRKYPKLIELTETLS